MEYVSVGNIPEDIIARYEKEIPEQLLDIWKNQGLGTLLDGYVKVINPEEYEELLAKSYFLASESIPIMTTAFGDIITWENNKYVGIVRYKSGVRDTLSTRFPLFLRLLDDPSFIKRNFQMDLYRKAVAAYGPLEYDECFGFVPLLALGGKQNVKNMKKVKIREHIAVITEFAGSV